jgi:CheY-like chemotaxis protein
VNEKNDDDDGNERLKEAFSYISKSLHKDYNINKSIVIGAIKVDRHSRLTFSKKLKSVLPIFPNDTIIVLKNLTNNDVIFKIQRNNEVIDTWTIKKEKNNCDSYLPNSDINIVLDNSKNLMACNYDYDRIENQLNQYEFKIMLIDDESDILDFYKDLLVNIDTNDHNKRYNIESFSSSAEALKRFIDIHTNNHFSYDLIIIDIKMPVISGLQLYQLFRIIDLEVKVLFISALDTPETLAGILPGIKSIDIIKKPFNIDYFISKVKEKLV